MSTYAATYLCTPTHVFPECPLRESGSRTVIVMSKHPDGDFWDHTPPKGTQTPWRKGWVSSGAGKVDDLKTPVCSKNQENVQNIMGPW